MFILSSENLITLLSSIDTDDETKHFIYTYLYTYPTAQQEIGKATLDIMGHHLDGHLLNTVECADFNIIREVFFTHEADKGVMRDKAWVHDLSNYIIESLIQLATMQIKDVDDTKLYHILKALREYLGLVEQLWIDQFNLSKVNGLVGLNVIPRGNLLIMSLKENTLC